jgi:hypothetical protein
MKPNRVFVVSNNYFCAINESQEIQNTGSNVVFGRLFNKDGHITCPCIFVS